MSDIVLVRSRLLHDDVLVHIRLVQGYCTSTSSCPAGTELVHVGLVPVLVHVGLVPVLVQVGLVQDVVQVHIGLVSLLVHVGLVPVLVHVGLVPVLVHVGLVQDGKLLDLFLLLLCLVSHDEERMRVASSNPANKIPLRI
jgi:hypothetical protein